MQPEIELKFSQSNIFANRLSSTTTGNPAFNDLDPSGTDRSTILLAIHVSWPNTELKAPETLFLSMFHIFLLLVVQCTVQGHVENGGTEQTTVVATFHCSNSLVGQCPKRMTDVVFDIWNSNASRHCDWRYSTVPWESSIFWIFCTLCIFSCSDSSPLFFKRW